MMSTEPMKDGLEDPTPVVSPVEATAAERTASVVRKPGPGFGLAIGLVIALLFLQGLVGVGVAGLILVSKALSGGSPKSDPVIIEHEIEGKRAQERTEPGPDRVASTLSERRSVLTLTMSSVLTTLLFAVIVLAIRERAAWRESMAFHWPHSAHLVIVLMVTLPSMLVASEAGTFAQRYLPRISGAQEGYATLSELPWLVVIFVGAVLPALGEELLFRGLIGRGLVARYGVGVGVAVTSILFGLMHLDPPQVVATALLAVPFHVLYLSGKSIWLPILAHGLNNSLAFTLMRLPVDSPWRLVLGGDENELMPPTVFLAAVLAWGFLLWWAVAMPTRWTTADGREWRPDYPTAEAPPPPLSAQRKLVHPGRLPVLSSVLSLTFLLIMILTAVRSL